MRQQPKVVKMTYMFLKVVNQIVGNDEPRKVRSYDLKNAILSVLEDEHRMKKEEKAKPSLARQTSAEKSCPSPKDFEDESLLSEVCALTAKVCQQLQMMQATEAYYFFGIGRIRSSEAEMTKFVYRVSQSIS